MPCRMTIDDRKRAALFLAFCLSAAGPAVSGSLDPPGPPAPTFKTLTEVEPRTAIPAGTGTFTISAAGSYYLTGDRSVTSGDGIVIGASNVTLDLNGFTLSGAPGTGDGIRLSAAFTRVTVKNGNVASFGGDGVGFDLPNNCGDCTIENVAAGGNSGLGITLDINGLIRGCHAGGNGGGGIAARVRSIVADCVAVGNGGTGIDAGSQCIVERCILNSNVDGIVAFASVVRGNQVTVCVGDGIRLSSDCLAENNDVDNITTVGKAGINVTSSDTLVRGNHVTDSDTGYKGAGQGALFVGNFASGNTTDYTIPAGDKAGAIVAINTNAGSSTNVLANFSY
ncbi:MAG: hypothetical protein U0166_08235 [Acidobacteriota bacterium]